MRISSTVAQSTWYGHHRVSRWLNITASFTTVGSSETLCDICHEELSLTGQCPHRWLQGDTWQLNQGRRQRQRRRQKKNDLIGLMRENNRAARAARTLVQFFEVVFQMTT